MSPLLSHTPPLYAIPRRFSSPKSASGRKKSRRGTRTLSRNALSDAMRSATMWGIKSDINTCFTEMSTMNTSTERKSDASPTGMSQKKNTQSEIAAT